MSFVNWVINSLASEDVIDLYFILSDIKEMLPFSSAESAAHAIGDAAGSYRFKGKQNGKSYDLTDHASVQELADDLEIPLGKLVL